MKIVLTATKRHYHPELDAKDIQQLESMGFRFTKDEQAETPCCMRIEDPKDPLEINTLDDIVELNRKSGHQLIFNVHQDGEVAIEVFNDYM